MSRGLLCLKNLVFLKHFSRDCDLFRLIFFTDPHQFDLKISSVQAKTTPYNCSSISSEIGRLSWVNHCSAILVSWFDKIKKINHPDKYLRKYLKTYFSHPL